ncbi:endonuclease/exonuclease/phosphatase family protein [Geodermatophilus sp. SYSU D00708]
MSAAPRSVPARPLRYRSLLAVVAVLAATLPAAVAVAPGGPQLTVMTQNTYVGTGLTDTFAVSSWPELVAAVSQDWANVLANDVPTRAGALADEIARLRPEVVGLQEVTLWRDQTPSDVRTHPAPNATRVAFDHLALLLDRLRARGLPYVAVATSTNADVEAPRLEPGTGLVDLRVTDRDVLLVRADVAARVSDPRHGHYAAERRLPFLTGPVRNTRGWTSIDYRVGPRTSVRIVNTHLEVGGPGSGPVQVRQADELLAIVAASPHPVIALGDFNAPADGSATDTYRDLTAVLDDAWTAVRPGDPGPTCCQGELLADPVGREGVRIDLVLTSGDLTVTGVARTGDEPFRSSPPPVWASDHVGVTARIAVRGRLAPTR